MYFSPTIIATLLVATAQACTELSYELHKRAEPAPEWGYGAEDGPLSWYSLDPVLYAACGKGDHQSPTNLDDKSASTEASNAYTLNYAKLTNVPFISTHHTVQADVASTNLTNTLTFGGKTYDLLQFHFHVPSEHRIEDEYFPMEVHFVHRAADKTLAVIGYVIEIGCTSTPALESVLSHVKELEVKNSTTVLPAVDLKSITEHFQSNNVFRYSGSLTTPPCTEGVQWIVSTEPLVLDVLLFNEAKRVLKFNSRYSQNNPGQPNLLHIV